MPDTSGDWTCQGNFAGCACLGSGTGSGSTGSSGGSGTTTGSGSSSGSGSGSGGTGSGGTGSTSGSGSGGGGTGSGGTGSTSGSGSGGGETGTGTAITTIFVAEVYEDLVTSFAEYYVAYADGGSNWCLADQIGDSESLPLCGLNVCVHGLGCGYYFEGCGTSNLYVTLNGYFYASCSWNNYANVPGTCGSKSSFASAQLVYTCGN